jgi:hypothetical protein
MALNAKEKAYNNTKRVDQEALEAGTYPARLVQVIDLGVQEQQPYKGDPKPPAQEIMTTYEFSDEFIKDEEGNELEDKPRWLSENFVLHNLDSELAKSSKRYVALDPNVEMDGDWTALVGRPAMVTIAQNKGTGKNAGRIFEKIVSTSTCTTKAAAKLPELKNPAKVFDQSDVATVDIFFTLPKWLQDKIKNGLEWEGSAMAKAVEGYKGDKNEDVKEKASKKKAKPVDEDEEEIETKASADVGDGDW